MRGAGAPSAPPLLIHRATDPAQLTLGLTLAVVQARHEQQDYTLPPCLYQAPGSTYPLEGVMHSTWGQLILWGNSTHLQPSGKGRLQQCWLQRGPGACTRLPRSFKGASDFT